MLGFLKNISPVELGVIILILIILFGSKIVTRLGRASGETVREIKKVGKSFTEAVNGDEDESK